MNIWIEFIFVIVRAGLVSLGTLMVQHGWISEQTAAHFSGPAAIWISAGLFIVGLSVGHSAWNKIKAAAIARIALMFPSSSPPAFVVAALQNFTKSALWYFATTFSATTSPEDKAKLQSAVQAIKKVLADNGLGEVPR